MIHFVVDEKTAGQRADRAIRVIAPGVDRALAMRLLRGGGISVNSAPATLRTVLQRGDAVAARVDPALLTPHVARAPKPPRPASAIPVLFLDAHVVVVNKPAGMATHPADGVEAGGTLVETVAAELQRRGVTTERPPAAAGRLDRGTSGLVVLTLSRDGERGMAKAMEGDLVKKEYLALVHGVTQPAFDVDEPLLVSKYTRGQSKKRKLKTALTAFERIAFSDDATLVRARPQTGRTHQIRRHLREASHPIIGDGRYGRREDRGAEHFFLHADTLAFPHPVDGRALTFHARLPNGFLAALKQHHIQPPAD